MIAGRSPACVCPGTGGIRTRQTSPRFMRPIRSGEMFYEIDELCCCLLPSRQFLSQFLRIFSVRSLSGISTCTPSGSGELGTDNAVGHYGADSGNGHNTQFIAPFPQMKCSLPISSPHDADFPPALPVSRGSKRKPPPSGRMVLGLSAGGCAADGVWDGAVKLRRGVPREQATQFGVPIVPPASLRPLLIQDDTGFAAGASAQCRHQFVAILQFVPQAIPARPEFLRFPFSTGRESFRHRIVSSKTRGGCAPGTNLMRLRNGRPRRHASDDEGLRCSSSEESVTESPPERNQPSVERAALSWRILRMSSGLKRSRWLDFRLDRLTFRRKCFCSAGWRDNRRNEKRNDGIDHSVRKKTTEKLAASPSFYFTSRVHIGRLIRRGRRRRRGRDRRADRHPDAAGGPAGCCSVDHPACPGPDRPCPAHFAGRIRRPAASSSSCRRTNSSPTRRTSPDRYCLAWHWRRRRPERMSPTAPGRSLPDPAASWIALGSIASCRATASSSGSKRVPKPTSAPSSKWSWSLAFSTR